MDWIVAQGNPNASPATVTGALVTNAVANAVTSAGTGSPNRLLNTTFITSGSLPNLTPTASFTVTGTSTTQNLGKGNGTSTYRVCNAGTTTCSSNVTVSY